MIGTALRVMVNDRLPAGSEVDARRGRRQGERRRRDECAAICLGRKGSAKQIPAVGVRSARTFDGTVVVWIHPDGKSSLWKDGKLVPAAQKILDAKAAILAVDVFGTGELSSDKPSGHRQASSPATRSATTVRCWPTAFTTS